MNKMWLILLSIGPTHCRFRANAEALFVCKHRRRSLSFTLSHHHALDLSSLVKP